MKRYVKLFESYVREYREHQQPDFPEGMHGYEGHTSGTNDDPVAIALELAQEYGIDPNEVQATIDEIGGGEETYGAYPFVEGMMILTSTITSLVLVSFLGANIEAKMKNKRWLTAEVEDRLEKITEENPELAEEDVKTLMKVVTEEVMNDPEVQEKLGKWRKDGGAPVHKRHRGPVYGYRGHIFGSGE